MRWSTNIVFYFILFKVFVQLCAILETFLLFFKRMKLKDSKIEKGIKDKTFLTTTQKWDYQN